MRLFALSVLLIPVLSFGQGSSVGSSYLKIPVHARVAAMGESGIADDSSFSSWSLNPANLASLRNSEIALSHSQWIQDVQSDMIGAAIPLSLGTLAFIVSNSTVGGIEVRDVPGPPIETFSAHSGTFGMGYALGINSSLFVGANVKYLYEKIYVDEAWGAALDIGGLYRTPIDGLTAGASLLNIGSMKEFRSTAAKLPSVFNIGAAYAFPESDFKFVVAATSVNELQTSVSRANLGAEATYDRLISLRLGYQTGFESRGFVGGVGFRYSIVKLDYAYVPFLLGLGNAHLLSAGFEL